MATSILDSREKMRELDKENVLGSVEQLADQVEHVWSAIQEVELPADYAQAKQVVVNGMGGSALGARVVKSVYKTSLMIPFEVVNHYQLPAYVGKDTLVILSSYSGSTEETLAAAEDAKSKGAMPLAIAAGGKLLDWAKTNNYPYFKIDPKYNPSNQPRMAIGYSVFAQVGLLAKLGIVSMTDDEVKNVVKLMRANAKGLAPESTEQNTAKFLAFAAVDKMINVVSAEHMEGAAHVFNNQLNENAKNVTHEALIPELNHHMMESLSFPKQLKDSAVFFFAQSKLYHPRVQARFPLTRDVVEQNGYSAETILLTGKTPMEQTWELIQLGAYTNFYLAMLNGINPAPIPWVDWFKDELAKVSK